MRADTDKRRLRNWESTQQYSLPGVITKQITKNPADRPARLSRRQLAPLLALLRRVAKGGDATTAVDAAALLPLVERGLAAAPAGQPVARAEYDVTLPDGSVQRLRGLAAVARAARKARSTVANALTKGRGTARFRTTDADGNPAEIVVRKPEEN